MPTKLVINCKTGEQTEEEIEMIADPLFLQKPEIAPVTIEERLSALELIIPLIAEAQNV